MIKKVYSKAGRSCRVTFELPLEMVCQTACLCGEFNDWDTESQPTQRRQDGAFTLAPPLKPGRAYRFRYLLDGARWENDPAVDGYVANPFGSADSLIRLYPW